MEKARAEVVSPQKQGSSISFRMKTGQLEGYLRDMNAFSLRTQLRRFFVDWDSFKKGLSDWQFWEPPPMQMLSDNGLGEEGVCEAHGYPHISIFPLGSKPPMCHEAMQLRADQKKEP